MEPRNTLHSLLLLADTSTSFALSADDLAEWSDSFRRAIIASAILREEAPATSVTCDQCPDGGTGEVYYVQRSKTTHAYINCQECGRVPVPLERLKQYGLDWESLAAWISKAMNTQDHLTTLVEERVWSIGHGSYSGHRLPIALVRGLYWPDAADLLVPVLSRPKQVLLAAPSAQISPPWLPKTALVVPLDAIITFDRRSLRFDAERLSAIVQDGLSLRPAREKLQVTYPLPTGCPIGQLRVEFVSKDSVRFHAPEARAKTFTFSDLGLQDGRRGDMPGVLWETLQIFAEHNGTITWEMEDVPSRVQKHLKKHVQRLRIWFQGIFQTEQDPFHPYRPRREYRCRFQIADKSYGGGGRSSL